jgi:DNA-binding beta-propeller fold protein YncE
MYRIAEIIENDGALSMINEVSFHPSGSYFAATYENINEVRIYDSRTRKLLHVLKNPESQFDGPHGVLFTDKYLLVANAHNRKQPGTINVYRNDGMVTKPIQIFQSPFNHLHEPHSLAIRGGRLVVTYCANLAPSGAIVSYKFNEETGKITHPLDKTEAWFSEYGDSKGICFNRDGTQILVTFQSGKKRNITTIEKIKKLRKQIRKNGLFSGKVKNNKIVKPSKNGIAIFPIDAEGKIGESPDRTIVKQEFCRLENVDIFNNTCVVTDVINRSFSLYDLTRDPKFKKPIQTVGLGKSAPHGAKFSPDGGLLVISCVGFKIVDKNIDFITWESPREDKVLVFERTG